jgi:hypothetical protein
VAKETIMDMDSFDTIVFSSFMGGYFFLLAFGINWQAVASLSANIAKVFG